MCESKSLVIAFYLQRLESLRKSCTLLERPICMYKFQSFQYHHQVYTPSRKQRYRGKSFNDLATGEICFHIMLIVSSLRITHAIRYQISTQAATDVPYPIVL